MRVAVAQIGARRHYVIPLIFERAGLLERLFTDSYAGNKPWLNRLGTCMPNRLRSKGFVRWLGRAELGIAPEKVTSFEWLGISYALKQRLIGVAFDRENVFAEVGRTFNDRVIRHGLGSADTVWGFNGAALELFRWAKARGVRCILDQTIAPARTQRALLQAEISRWPGWQPSLQLPAENGPLTTREEAEWDLADLIITGSTYVAKELARRKLPPGRCRVVPYGVDTLRFTIRPSAKAPAAGRRLRVLFVGEVGLRKGAPYALEALRMLGPDKVEGRFAGSVAIAPPKLAPYRNVASFLGHVPRQRMQDLYAWADVFVLPSICEGSALVTYEALASGLPVICTPNTGSIVRNGVDGFIVPIGDAEAIAESLQRVASLQWRRGDQRLYSENWGIDGYQERLMAALVTVA